MHCLFLKGIKEHLHAGGTSINVNRTSQLLIGVCKQHIPVQRASCLTALHQPINQLCPELSRMRWLDPTKSGGKAENSLFLHIWESQG